jgi:hypothetical protein
MVKQGILSRVLRWIFVEKSVRASLDKRRDEKVGDAEVGSENSVIDPNANERDQMKESALMMLREKRTEFEALDKSVQDRVAKAAAKALDSGGKPEKSKGEPS